VRVGLGLVVLASSISGLVNIPEFRLPKCDVPAVPQLKHIHYTHSQVTRQHWQGGLNSVSKENTNITHTQLYFTTSDFHE